MTGVGRHTRARDRAARRRTLLDLLARIDRLTPTETVLLVEYTRTELAASDALRSSLIGIERAHQKLTERMEAAEEAIVEAEHDRDAARAALAEYTQFWTFDPDLDDGDPDEDDYERLLDLGAAEFYSEAPPKICGEYGRPSSRRPVRLDRHRDLVDLPDLDTYQPAPA